MTAIEGSGAKGRMAKRQKGQNVENQKSSNEVTDQFV